MNENGLTNKELVAQLQELGINDINPNATKAQLQEMLSKASSGQQTNQPTPSSDIEKIMAAINGLATTIKSVSDDVQRMKDGGKNDFMNEMKADDVKKADESKKNVHPKVVEIVEQTLGVDFGIEVLPNLNSPGFNFTIMVPKRLSPIPDSTRPILDNEIGGYKKDPKTQMVIEEVYWPGDRRSRAVGSTDSFDLIRDHCNKVRAHIVTYYEKLKKPLPEFKLKA